MHLAFGNVLSIIEHWFIHTALAGAFEFVYIVGECDLYAMNVVGTHSALPT